MTFHVPEKYRVLEAGLHSSTAASGNNGWFAFKREGREVRCLASDGVGWEHVSVSIQGRKMPSWNLMCYVKDLFWSKDDVVVQYHPAEEDYVNWHPACLHLWRPTDVEIPVPPALLVGPKN